MKSLTFVCLAMAAGAICSRVVVWYDTGLYHALRIQWLHDFGHVRGLGNLHHRLAMESGWFYRKRSLIHTLIR